MTCTYGSAIAGAPRCVRTLDRDAPPGPRMNVCGQPVAGGRHLRARYCASCLAELTMPRRYQPRISRNPVADDWVLPTANELAEVFG